MQICNRKTAPDAQSGCENANLRIKNRIGRPVRSEFAAQKPHRTTHPARFSAAKMLKSARLALKPDHL
jgi:hypothetical protein